MKTFFKKLTKLGLIPLTIVILSMIGCGNKDNNSTATRFTTNQAGQCVDSQNGNQVTSYTNCQSNCTPNVNQNQNQNQNGICYNTAGQQIACQNTGTCTGGNAITVQCDATGGYYCYGAPTASQGGSCGYCGSQGTCAGYYMYNSGGQRVYCQ